MVISSWIRKRMVMRFFPSGELKVTPLPSTVTPGADWAARESGIERTSEAKRGRRRRRDIAGTLQENGRVVTES